MDSGKWIEEADRMRAEIERLRAALKPFADRADAYNPTERQQFRDDDIVLGLGRSVVTVGDLRRARDLLR
jgi:hypothetical protein